jgi:hypothetical protein
MYNLAELFSHAKGTAMTSRMQRTQILLEPDQHRALSDLARAEGRSLSDIVREIVRAQLAQRTHEQSARRQRQLASLEQIRAHRQTILARRKELPNPAELIEQMRDERDAELTDVPNRD